MDGPCIEQTVCKVLKIFQYGKYLVAYVLKQSGIFPFQSCSVVFFINRSQTVETLIRHRDLRRLIWVGTVCLCPSKRTIGLNGLNIYDYVIVTPWVVGLYVEITASGLSYVQVDNHGITILNHLHHC